MFRRVRSRRTLKWIGSIACVLLAAVAGIFGLMPPMYYDWVGRKDGRLIEMKFGVHSSNAFVIYSRELSARPPRYVDTKTTLFHIDWYWQQDCDEYRTGDSSGKSILAGYTRTSCYRAPIWLIATLFALLPVPIWCFARRRPLPGHCGKCGYDLTGNVSGRCPECGTEMVAGTPRAPEATRRGERAVSANEAGGGNATGV